MFQVPRFKAKYHVESIPEVGTFLLSEFDRHVLEGHSMQQVVPLLDGIRSWQQVLALASIAVGEDEARAALQVLVDHGHLVENDPSMPVEHEAYWNELSRTPAQARQLLAQTQVHLRGVGKVDLSPFAQALAGFGFRHDSTAPPSVLLVVAEDYQHPALADINAECIARGLPWLLVKPVGLRQWIGPLFTPGRSACWQCLESRLRHNREVESYIQRSLGHQRPLPVARARLPLVEQQVACSAVLQLLRWLTQGAAPELESRIITTDVYSLQQQSHWVLRRPQCPCCGDPALARRGGQPILLRSQRALAAAENGSRLETADATFARYAHHVSEISGIVKGIFPSEQNLRGPLRVYMAGHNFALKNDELFFLKDGLRSSSSGKGRTDSQARTSALCEALERYSGLYRGEEERIDASLEELGDRAVDPRSVLLFSDLQYEQRLDWLERGGRFQVVPMPFDPTARISWSPLWSHTEQRIKYLPTSSLYYGFRDPDPNFYCWGDSNGNAAGSCVEDAILQGFLELVERDAVAVWWYNRLQRPAVDLDALQDPYITQLRDYFAGFGREFWVLDLTHDLGIPVYAAINRRTDHPVEDIVMGFGAHLDARIALNRAITEMNQFIPAVLNLDADGNAVYAFDDRDTVHWWRTATLANQPYLAPSAELCVISCPAEAAPDLKAQVERCFAAVEALGHEVLILDQTRADVGLPVVKVVVPGLRHFWARFAPGRLYQVPVKMGWLPTATLEADLNPIPMFV